MYSYSSIRVFLKRLPETEEVRKQRELQQQEKIREKYKRKKQEFSLRMGMLRDTGKMFESKSY